MAKMIKLTIDGREIQAPEGSNLIDAADLNGTHIPNLCYLKGLKGIGACRLCMVEVEGLKAPIIACTTKVKEGMSVKTKTEKVLETRKFVLDLILSMHPLDCMTCTKAGVCRLQSYAYDFEIKESSFTRKKFGFALDEANPFIKRDPDYCILCGRCVRVCRNQGTNVLDFMGRGVGSKVTTANDKPLQESGCTFCGSCVDVCPVNALLEADRWRRGREWEYETVRSTCLLCGNGCDIAISLKDGSPSKINAGARDGSAERYICAYGRFGFDSLDADTRIRVPLKRVDGSLEETTWDDAVEIIAKKLKATGKKAGFISTASILNEDALTMKRFAAEVVKTSNVDSTASLYCDESTMVSAGADIETADLMVLVGLDPSQWKRVLPALDAVVRRRVNAGAKLITINSKEPGISSVAAVSLVGDEPELLKALVKASIAKGIKSGADLASAVSDAEINENIDMAASLFAESKSPVILTLPALYPAASNLGLLKGTVVSVPFESNAKGVILMGVGKTGKTYREMTADEMALLYVVGEVPLAKRPDADFLIVQASHLSELAKQADVVLPAAAYLEAEGSIVDYQGRVKKVMKVVEPAGQAKSHREIFVSLAPAMGAAIKESKPADTKKLAEKKVKVAPSAFVRREGFDVDAEELLRLLNASVINGSRLLWLRESEKVLA
jgi:NADH dehydrogenase/NADH:ubiquinone oxidoreductase subunit G